MLEKLTEMEKDALKEMANVATGNATTLLSQKTCSEVTLSVPICELISIDELKTSAMIPKGITLCALAELKGQLIGSVMLVFDPEDAFAMADLLQKKKVGTTKWLSAIDQEAILDIGISLIRCYLKALSDFLDREMWAEELKVFSILGDAVLDLLLINQDFESPILVLRNEIALREFCKGKITFIFFLHIKGALSLLRKAGLG